MLTAFYSLILRCGL